MATTKYKYTKVRQARHIMRDTLGSVGSMTKPGLWAGATEDDVTGQELAKEVYQAVCEAQHMLRGKPGMVREQQVERITEARETVQAALKLTTKLAKASITPQQEALAADIKSQLTLAKEHGTAALSYAKNRRFESSKAEYEATHVVDAVKESMDDELAEILSDLDH